MSLLLSLVAEQSSSPTLDPLLAIAFIIAVGVGAQWLAWRVNIPSILPLLAVGFLLGPVFQIIQPESLGGDLLFPAVSLAVGLILFEGGLTLRFPEVKEIRRVVLNLVTVGAIITWMGATAAAHYIANMSWELAFLFGALVIVTGPTVIGPLLRNVRPKATVANILKWEGILIDPIGALVAVIVFEFILLIHHQEPLQQTIWLFSSFLLVGTLVGIIGGGFLTYLLRKRLIPDYLTNFMALATVFAVFALSNTLADESGLLATTVMGLFMANVRSPMIEGILSFKEDLTILAISLLFIILAARIEISALNQVLTFKSFLLIAALMLVVRPLNIFASTIGSKLSLNEKIFLSWLAPRGIVAAAVTSLFASQLASKGIVDAELLVPLVFLVIVCTVVINSLTAKPVGWMLGVVEPDPQGFLILGSHSVARQIAHFLKDEEFRVLLADTNWSNIASARVEGLETYYGNPLSDQSEDELRLSGIGKLLALTSNDEANALTALKYAKEFGSEQVYQLKPSHADGGRAGLSEGTRGRSIFYEGITYADLRSLFRRGGELKKTQITENFTLDDFEKKHGDDYLPMFIIKDKKILVVSEGWLELESNDFLISLVMPKDSAIKRTITRTFFA